MAFIHFKRNQKIKKNLSCKLQYLWKVLELNAIDSFKPLQKILEAERLKKKNGGQKLRFSTGWEKSCYTHVRCQKIGLRRVLMWRQVHVSANVFHESHRTHPKSWAIDLWHPKDIWHLKDCSKKKSALHCKYFPTTRSQPKKSSCTRQKLLTNICSWPTGWASKYFGWL